MIAPRDITLAVDRAGELRIHVVGIGGAGMSAIAGVLASMGHTVTGSDLAASAALEGLRAQGIEVFIGHDAAHLGVAELVTKSTAIPDHNVEIKEAEERGIPVLDRATTLTALTALRSTISVAGTHGKTTTASMLATILDQTGQDPGFIIGGDVPSLGGGWRWADGEWFVVEADESDGTFTRLHSSAAIVTSVEPDHLGYYGSEAALFDAFDSFAGAVSGPLVLSADDEGAAALTRVRPAVTYGFAPDSDFKILEPVSDQFESRFTLEVSGRRIAEVKVALPGRHNMANACGAIAAAAELGVDAPTAAAALSAYRGVGRRFERRGERARVTFVDDYAHLPAEVEAALEAAQSGSWDRVICVFQPHRYSRTEALAHTFVGAFERADRLVVTDIYASGEPERDGVSGKLIVDAVLEGSPWSDIAYLPDRPSLLSYLLGTLRPGDLCLTLGAGDLTSLPDEVMAGLAPLEGL